LGEVPTIEMQQRLNHVVDGLVARERGGLPGHTVGPTHMRNDATRWILGTPDAQVLRAPGAVR
jgi:hypothetical protein